VRRRLSLRKETASMTRRPWRRRWRTYWVHDKVAPLAKTAERRPSSWNAPLLSWASNVLMDDTTVPARPPGVNISNTG
jgi:hypothetical protein